VFQRLAVDAVVRAQSRASASLPASPPPDSKKSPFEDVVRAAGRLSYEAAIRAERLERAVRAREELETAEAYRLANTPHINRKSLSMLTARKAGNRPSQALSAPQKPPKTFTPAQALASGLRLMHRKRTARTTTASRQSSREGKARPVPALQHPYSQRTLSAPRLEELQRTYTLKRGWELGKGSETQPTTKDSNETPGKEVDWPDLSAISQHCEEDSLAKLLACPDPKPEAVRPKAPFPLAVSVPRELLDFVQSFPSY